MDASSSAIELNSTSSAISFIGPSTTSGLVRASDIDRALQDPCSPAPGSAVSPSSSAVTFEERKAFPHLHAFASSASAPGGANNNGPGGVPIIKTDGGSLVFPAPLLEAHLVETVQAPCNTWRSPYPLTKNSLRIFAVLLRLLC